jgi:hypothetical protein
LCEQTIQDWEWIIIENSGAEVPIKIKKDRRVSVSKYENNLDKPVCIGAVKLLSNTVASGDFIIELDGDDFLLPNALEKVLEAFQDGSVHYVYSNNCDFTDKWETRYFSEYYGWRRREFIYKEHNLCEMHDFPPSAQNFRYIYWQPDHLKAWRKSSYMGIGGHNPSIFICDDQDLCMRYYIKYGAKGFKHLDECLYMYRIHDNNSCVVFNADVIQNADRIYKQYIELMAERWADDEGLLKIDLGGAILSKENYAIMDIRESADIVCDLNGKWALSDNSVGVLRASHILEHLKDPINSMNEAYRVLAPGGFLFIDVPSTDGRGAFQDPTHCSFWNENSFWYYTDKNYSKFISPQYKGRFQTSSLYSYEMGYKIPIVRADLIAVKQPYESSAAGMIRI